MKLQLIYIEFIIVQIFGRNCFGFLSSDLRYMIISRTSRSPYIGSWCVLFAVLTQNVMAAVRFQTLVSNYVFKLFFIALLIITGSPSSAKWVTCMGHIVCVTFCVSHYLCHILCVTFCVCHFVYHIFDKCVNEVKGPIVRPV